MPSKTIRNIAFLSLFALLLSPFSSINFAQADQASFWKLSGTALSPVKSTWTINLASTTSYQQNGSTILTTGLSSTFVGYQAGNSYTKNTCDFEVAVGYRALWQNTNCGENTAIGWQSQFGNIGNNRNTSVGTNTMGALGNASHDDTAVGNDSMRNATSTSNDTFVGKDAGRNPQGNQNTGLGAFVLTGNESGGSYGAGNNTAVGFQSMSNTGLSTASGNAALGYQALQNILSGGDNVAIGDQAGNKITGGGNVVIGGTQAASISLLVNGTRSLGNEKDSHYRLAMATSSLAVRKTAVDSLTFLPQGRTISSTLDNLFTASD